MNVSRFGLLVGGLAIAAGLIVSNTSLAQRRERVGESGTGRVPAGGGRGTGGGAGVGGAAGAMIGGRVGSSIPSGSQVRNNIRGEAYGRPTDSYRRGTSGLDRAADRYDRKWFDDSPDATARGTDLERAVDRTSRRDQDWIDRDNPVGRYRNRDDRYVDDRSVDRYGERGGLANDADLVRRDRYDRGSRRIDDDRIVDRRVVDRDVYDRRSYTFDGTDPDIDFEERNFDRAIDRIERNRDRVVDRTDRVNRGLDTASDRVTRSRDRFDDRFDDRVDDQRDRDDRRDRDTRRDVDDRRERDDRRTDPRQRDSRDTRGDESRRAPERSSRDR